MERLWLANLEPGTTDDEVKELVRKYAPDLECSEIMRMDGDGSRPAALMTFMALKSFDRIRTDPASIPQSALAAPAARTAPSMSAAFTVSVIAISLP